MGEISKTEFIADSNQPIITMRRTFDAPRRVVFDASTRAEYMKQWYGPARYHIVKADTDLRVGGAWRIVHQGDDGRFEFHGVYREIDAPRRIVYTWIFDGQPDQEVVETAEYEETNGKTTMTTTSRFPSMKARDAHLELGAEAGARESWDRLAGLVKTLNKPSAAAPQPLAESLRDR